MKMKFVSIWEAYGAYYSNEKGSTIIWFGFMAYQPL